MHYRVHIAFVHASMLALLACSAPATPTPDAQATCEDGQVCEGELPCEQGSCTGLADATSQSLDAQGAHLEVMDTSASPHQNDTADVQDSLAHQAPQDTQVAPDATDTTPDDADDLGEILDDIEAASVTTGSFGDPCEASVDCDAGACVQHLGEGTCTQPCDDTCPSGWTCKPVQSESGQTESLCVSLFETLCHPCIDESDCASLSGAVDCISYGDEGAFCGATCALNTDCPEGFLCGETLTILGQEGAHCIPESGLCACSTFAVDQGLWTECEVANDIGVCRASRTCTEGGLTGCDAPVPTLETCNGIDDDCDDDIDEDIDCDDADPCTLDGCLGAAGCAHDVSVGIACDDGDLTTANDTCQGDGQCLGEAIVCPTGACLASATPNGESCDITPSAAGELCNDGDPATKGDTCDGQGGCAGTPYTCTPEQCHAASTPNGVDCDITPSAAGELCDDGDLATKGDACDGQDGCAGTPYTCTPEQCHAASTPNGVDCDITHSAAGELCDDGDPATNGDACDGQGGCAGTPYTCELTQCITSATPNGVDCELVFASDDTACDDEDPETKDDLCDGQGVCEGTPYTCDPTQCEATSEPNGVDCDVVLHPEDTPCDDDDLTTQDDLCDEDGLCAGTPYTCEPTQCVTSAIPNGVDCDVVYAAPGADCDDADPTTKGDACDGQGECAGTPYVCPLTQCLETSVPNGVDCDTTFATAGAGCDDDDVSTLGDQCDGQGTCAGTPYACVPGLCEVSSAPNGVDCDVIHAEAGAPCDDGAPSTQEDACDGQGGCAGTPYTCEPAQCEATSTPNGVDCDVTYSAAGSTCDDASQSTKDDLCDGQGGCIGTPYTCEPAPCEVTSIPNGVDCDVVLHLEGTPCDDANAATHDDTCDGEGQCLGAYLSCEPPACHAPTGLWLGTAPEATAPDFQSLEDNLAPGTVVAYLMAEDVDEGDLHHFALTDNPAYPDNAAFLVDAGALVLTSEPDYDQQTLYTLELQVTDTAGFTFVGELSLPVTREHLVTSAFFVQEGATWDGKSPSRPVGRLSDLVDAYDHTGSTTVQVTVGTYPFEPDETIGCPGNGNELRFTIKGGYKGDGLWREEDRNVETRKPPDVALEDYPVTRFVGSGAPRSNGLFEPLEGWFRSATTVEGVTLSDFEGGAGGLFVDKAFKRSGLRLVDSTVRDCTAGRLFDFQNGLVGSGQGQPTGLTRTHVRDCVLTGDGGVIFAQQDTVSIVNSVFEGLQGDVERRGGVLYGKSTNELLIVNNTFHGAMAHQGPLMALEPQAGAPLTLHLVNNLVSSPLEAPQLVVVAPETSGAWEDWLLEVHHNAFALADGEVAWVQFSDPASGPWDLGAGIWLSTAGNHTGPEEDAGFVHVSTVEGGDSDLSLSDQSVARDQALSSYILNSVELVPSEDTVGVSRDTQVDIGAYEYRNPGPPLIDEEWRPALPAHSAYVGYPYTGPEPVMALEGWPLPTWTVEGLPSSSIDPETGVVAYAPDTPGAFPVTVTATNDHGATSASWTLTVYATPHTVDGDLVAHWTFDGHGVDRYKPEDLRFATEEGSALSIEAPRPGEAGNYVGVMRGETCFTPSVGMDHGAIFFHGPARDGWMEAGPVPGSHPELTVALWMKATEHRDQVLVSKQPAGDLGVGWEVRARADGALVFAVGSHASQVEVSALQGVDTFTRGVTAHAYPATDWVRHLGWTHVAASYSAGTARLYINGALMAEAHGLEQSVAETTVPLMVGRSRVPLSPMTFDGLIDELQIYRQALSPSEVWRLSRPPASDPDLIPEEPPAVIAELLEKGANSVKADDLNQLMGFTTEQLRSFVPDNNPDLKQLDPETGLGTNHNKHWHWCPEHPERLFASADPDVCNWCPSDLNEGDTGCVSADGSYYLYDPDNLDPKYASPLIEEFQGPLGQTIAIEYFDVLPKGVDPADPDADKQRYKFSYKAQINRLKYEWIVPRLKALAWHYKHTAPGEDAEAYAYRAAVILDQFAQNTPGWLPSEAGQNEPTWYLQPVQYKDPPDEPASMLVSIISEAQTGHLREAMELCSAFHAIHGSAALKQLSTELNSAETTTGDLGAHDDWVRLRIEEHLIRDAMALTLAQTWERILMGNLVRSYVGPAYVGQMLNRPELAHWTYDWSRQYLYKSWPFTAGMHANDNADAMGVMGYYGIVESMLAHDDPPGYFNPINGLHLSSSTPFASRWPEIGGAGYQPGETAPDKFSLLSTYLLKTYPNSEVPQLHDCIEQSPLDHDLLTEGLQERTESTTEHLYGWGHTVLGDGTYGDQVQAQLHAKNGGSHAHSGGLGLVLFRDGRELLGDIGYMRTQPTEFMRQFSNATMTHNTVVIDRENQLNPYDNRRYVFGNTELFVPDLSGLKVVRVDNEKVYAQATTYRRTLLLVTHDITRPYLIDIFHVKGGGLHDLHLRGALVTNQDQLLPASTEDFSAVSTLPLAPLDFAADLMPLEPITKEQAETEPPPLLIDGESWDHEVPTDHACYGLIRRVGHAPSADADFRVNFEFAVAEGDPLETGLPGGTPLGEGSRHHVVANPEMQVLFGQSPRMRQLNKDDNPKGHILDEKVYNEWAPHLILRTGEVGGVDNETVFVVVHEPYRSIDADDMTVTRLEDTQEGAIGLKITFGDGREDTFLVALDEPQTITGNGMTLVDGLIGGHTKGPLGEHGWLIGGTSLDKDEVSLSQAVSRYEGVIHAGQIAFLGEDADTFDVSPTGGSPPLPLSTLFGERSMHVTHGTSVDGHHPLFDHRDQAPIMHAYPITSVEEFGDGQQRITLDGNHGLLIDGDTTTERHFPDLTYEGKNTFVVHNYTEGAGGL